MPNEMVTVDLQELLSVEARNTDMMNRFNAVCAQVTHTATALQRAIKQGMAVKEELVETRDTLQETRKDNTMLADTLRLKGERCRELEQELNDVKVALDDERKRRHEATKEQIRNAKKIKLAVDIMQAPHVVDKLTMVERETLETAIGQEPSKVRHSRSRKRGSRGVAQGRTSLGAQSDDPDESNMDDTRDTLNVSKLRSGRTRRSRSEARVTAASTQAWSASDIGNNTTYNTVYRTESQQPQPSAPPMATLDECLSPAATPSHVQPRSHHRRSMSAGQPNTVRQKDRMATTPREMQSPGSSLYKQHYFTINETVVKVQKCVVCSSRLVFGTKVLRCADCRMFVHSKCQEEAPRPCLGVSYHRHTPSKQVLLKDQVTTLPPHVPGVVLMAVKEIERRGLNDTGLYRLSGSKKEVDELLHGFRSQKQPNLKTVSDVHCLTNLVSRFLNSCQDRVIPAELRTRFINTAKQNQEDSQYYFNILINDMPGVNRDTLAFIIRHLQIVSETPQVSMSADSLSRVFGPTLMGELASSRPQDCYKDVAECNAVIESLISLPPNFWQRYLDCENRDLYPSFDEGFSTETASSVTGTVKSIIRSTIFGSGSRGKNALVTNFKSAKLFGSDFR